MAGAARRRPDRSPQGPGDEGEELGYASPIPSGHELGHLCHAAEVERCDGGPECPHRACVNPAHLVPVSQATTPRGIAARHAAQTTCPQGHPYDHVTHQPR